MNDIDYRAVIEIINNFLENEKVEIYEGLLETLQGMRNCCENNPDGTINVY